MIKGKITLIQEDSPKRKYPQKQKTDNVSTCDEENADLID